MHKSGILFNWQLSLIIGAIVLFSSSCDSEDKVLTIAAAANTQYALEKITEDFETKTGIKTELIISSSGKHTAQIIAGAPYDIFISADLKFPVKLYNSGFTTDAPKVYALGKLVLWSSTLETLPTLTELISSDKITHIAVPNPITAPYGLATKEALEHLGMWNELSDRFVYGESVAQTNQYILSGAAEVGFTAASVVLSPKLSETGSWSSIDTSYYSPIKQGAVILKNSNQPEAAEMFFRYLYSSEAAQTLEAFGYIINSEK